MKQVLYPSNPILFVDDEINTLNSFRLTLRSAGITNVVTCQDSRQVQELLKEQQFEFVVLDVIMPHYSGQELLAIIKNSYPELPILMITGLNDVDIAVECMNNGAFDYLTKPVEREKLITRIRKVIEHCDLSRENRELQRHLVEDSLDAPEAFDKIITASPVMTKVFKYCESVAKSGQPVLINGETGVGKELIAQAIHNSSGLSGPFLSVNIAGVDDHMFSDTLFGHKKGAFTGAVSDRTGFVEQAAGGTLFLDEIGDLSLASQIKLLRLLQEREYTPLGVDRVKIAHTRVLTATNKNLEEAIGDGTFRADLFYRLKTHAVCIPPLKERKDDIPLLVKHFSEIICKQLEKPMVVIENAFMSCLKQHRFPGNIRELQAIMFDVISSAAAGRLTVDALTRFMSVDMNSVEGSLQEEMQISDKALDWHSIESLPTIKEATGGLILEALERAGHNQRKAAEVLGISQQALSKRLKKK